MTPIVEKPVDPVPKPVDDAVPQEESKEPEKQTQTVETAKTNEVDKDTEKSCLPPAKERIAERKSNNVKGMDRDARRVPTLALALRAGARRVAKSKATAKAATRPAGIGSAVIPPRGAAAATATPVPPSTPPPKPKLDVIEEISRIFCAEGPLEVLGLPAGGPPPGEDELTTAWKRLVLLLHPDKLHRLPEGDRQRGADALHYVHQAKDELRKKAQEQSSDVPLAPQADGLPRLLETASGRRKVMISWKLQESQDPSRPVENYEVWGPRYFSERGEPFDWVLLATLPNLQASFVVVEEAPTQQDVMWAADRVLRPTLPISVHAVNGKGSSEALNVEVTWTPAFPWMRGSPSVMCTTCFRLNQCTGQWTRCSNCQTNIPSASRIVIRCVECQGELLWEAGSRCLKCTCCLKIYGKDMPQAWRPAGKQVLPPRPPVGTRPVHSSADYGHNGYGARNRKW